MRDQSVQLPAEELAGVAHAPRACGLQERVPLLCLAAAADDMGVYEHLISKVGQQG